MIPLHKLQIDLARAILDNDSSINEKFIIAGQLDAQRRLRLYRNNVFHTLIEALRAVYPVIYRLVGDEFFLILADRYIHAHPSLSGNLHDFGNKLSSFLQQFEPASNLPYLGDVAKLEWAYHHAFHAADADGIDISKFEQSAMANSETLRFILNPAASIIKSTYPILEIWQKNQDHFQGDDSIMLDGSLEFLLVNRIDCDIQFQRLEKNLYDFLLDLSLGATFSDACLAATKSGSDLNLAESLYFLIHYHVFVDYVV